MAQGRAWWKLADEYLDWKNVGERYALRLFELPDDELARDRMRFVRGEVSASLYDCGPKPWPDAVHAAVAVMRGYYCREMDGGPFGGFEGEVPTYLIVLPDDAERVWVAGTLGFYYFGPDQLKFGDGYQFMYAWVHPFLRRRGLMESAVKLAQADLGLFRCETPISRGMRELLRKIGHPQADDLKDMEVHGKMYR